MNEGRRFTDRERTALFLAAGGRCSRCGKDLAPGWHADHERPWSRGGTTDVINGQALCPKCNLKKGNRMTTLRPWQDAALAGLHRTSGDYLVVAAPGTGKTRFALVATQQLIEMSQAQRVIVVAPTSHLRVQWSQAAATLGVQLDHLFTNGSGALARDFDGVVVTYAAVASSPLLFRKLASDVPTLVILDEVHHGGDTLTWGGAIRTAFEVATRRLLLSGTPTRTDRNPVPFVRYDDRGNFVAEGGHGYTYDYGEAIRDHVTRAIEFQALDGSMRWREAGAIIETQLKDADEETLVNAHKTALDPDGQWIADVLRRADSELTRHRSEVPDAGALVVAPDQYSARRYAAMLATICGESATLAISEESESSDRIAEFASGTSRWIVAVQMISEGVDIPRLAVGVYASRYRTDLFFRQVVGRFVRMRGINDETTATLLIPSIEPLLSYAQEIERMVSKALREEQERLSREDKEYDQLSLRLDLVEPLDSSEAIHHSTIYAGDAYTDEELQRAQTIIEARNLPASVTAAQIAGVLRMVGAGKVWGTATIHQPELKTRPLADEKASYRRLIKRKVGYLKNLTDTPYSRIHLQLNQICGDRAETATAETLQQRLDILDKWIGSAHEVGSF